MHLCVFTVSMRICCIYAYLLYHLCVFSILRYCAYCWRLHIALVWIYLHTVRACNICIYMLAHTHAWTRTHMHIQCTHTYMCVHSEYTYTYIHILHTARIVHILAFIPNPKKKTNKLHVHIRFGFAYTRTHIHQNSCFRVHKTPHTAHTHTWTHTHTHTHTHTEHTSAVDFKANKPHLAQLSPTQTPQ